jgi:hypothetical protein
MMLHPRIEPRVAVGRAARKGAADIAVAVGTNAHSRGDARE